MNSHRPQSLRVLICGHASFAALFIAGLYFGFVRERGVGDDIAVRRAVLEEKQPVVLLVGNSLLKAAVDGDEFSTLSGLPTVAACSDGSSSLWWYLYVKNVVAQTKHKPRYVGIMFRDAFLTEPTYRVTGSYQKPIRQLMTGDDPLVEKLSFGDASVGDITSPLTWAPREARNWLNLKIEKRTENVLGVLRDQGRPALKEVFAAEKMQRAAYDEFQLGYEDLSDPVSFDFHARVEDSYLPHILRLLREQDITPIFIRAKRRRDLDPTAEPPEVQAYVVELKKYLTERGAMFFDFTHEPRLAESHFGAGDHLKKAEGRQVFMRLLSEQMTPAIAQSEARRLH